MQAFATIGRELDQLYERLEARDLAAGSPALVWRVNGLQAY